MIEFHNVYEYIVSCAIRNKFHSVIMYKCTKDINISSPFTHDARYILVFIVESILIVNRN